MLASRRRQLVAHSAQLRAVLGVEATALALRFGLVDRVMVLARSGLARGARGSAAGCARALFGRPRLLFRNAGRLPVLWPILKPFLPKLADLWREREP